MTKYSKKQLYLFILGAEKVQRRTGDKALRDKIEEVKEHYYTMFGCEWNGKKREITEQM